MEVGESKTITVPPGEAFGHMREDLVMKVKKGDLPENVPPTIGRILRLKRPEAQNLRWKVSEVKEGTVTLNANHPLAGQTLELDVEMVAIL
jgi:peptidylprolyl isomerase